MPGKPEENLKDADVELRAQTLEAQMEERPLAKKQEALQEHEELRMDQRQVGEALGGEEYMYSLHCLIVLPGRGRSALLYCLGIGTSDRW